MVATYLSEFLRFIYFNYKFFLNNLLNFGHNSLLIGCSFWQIVTRILLAPFLEKKNPGNVTLIFSNSEIFDETSLDKNRFNQCSGCLKLEWLIIYKAILLHQIDVFHCDQILRIQYYLKTHSRFLKNNLHEPIQLSSTPGFATSTKETKIKI